MEMEVGLNWVERREVLSLASSFIPFLYQVLPLQWDFDVCALNGMELYDEGTPTFRELISFVCVREGGLSGCCFRIIWSEYIFKVVNY